MIKNFIYILKRFKTSSVLNILGLSVAFAVFSIAMIQVHYDFSYDRSFKQSKSIYMFTGVSKGDDRLISAVSIPFVHQVTNQLPEIQAACIYKNEAKQLFKLQDRNDYFSFNFGRTDEGFLKIFTPEIISGDARKAFTEKNNVLLTSDVAKTLFGTKDPVGQTIWRDTVAYTVVAVCKPFPDNCSLQTGIYTTILGAWDYDVKTGHNYEGFFLVQPENISILQKKLNQPDLLELSYSKRIELIPLKERYFNPELMSSFESKGNPATTWSLMAIGILIMLIACINFMNFSMAMIPSRVRGMNIQKVLGIDPGRLRFWVASEAACFAILSFCIALVLIILFKELHLNDFFPADVSLEKNIPVLLGVFFTGVVISTLFGLYPAFRVTSFQPAMALSGSFSQSKRSAYLRNVLITVQFFAAIALICIAGFIKIQHDYMINYSWGFQKENVTYLPIQTRKTIDITTFENEIKKNSSVTACTASYDLPGSIAQNWGINADEKQIGFAAWIVRYDFANFFGIHVIEGRNFIPDDEGKYRLICNQTFLKTYDYAYNSGMKLSDMDVVGVCKDIHFESLRSDIRPLCFIPFDIKNFCPHYYFYIKIQGKNTLQTIEYLKNAWGKLSDKPFDLHFLDDTLDNLYKTENNLAKLISIFGLIAVVIAVMGVYGLIVFNARYKAKEIAIRKVNGSTVREIMLMLNRNVLTQLGIAFVIAVPVAWFAAKKWLENFAYKIPIYWWVFLLGGLIVLLITLLTVSAQSYRAAIRNPTIALNME